MESVPSSPGEGGGSVGSVPSSPGEGEGVWRV